MCTISWSDPAAGTFDVIFNRDEKHTRPSAEPPREQVCGSLRALFPVDPQGGGTWMGVNERGLVAALLNGYVESALQRSSGAASRGRLVTSLLGAVDLQVARKSLRSAGVAELPSFHLFLFQPGFSPCRFWWDGVALREEPLPVQPVFTTSGFSPREVISSRLDLFGNMFPAGATIDTAQRLEFHRSQQPSPGAHAVCMYRSDAATRSIGRITIASGLARFDYDDDFPFARFPRVSKSLSLT